MLTASLQSTWETQRAKQARPKYLQSTQYGDEGDSKAYGGEEKSNGARGYNPTRDISGPSGGDLPNLRIPQVRSHLILNHKVPHSLMTPS